MIILKEVHEFKPDYLIKYQITDEGGKAQFFWKDDSFTVELYQNTAYVDVNLTKVCLTTYSASFQSRKFGMMNAKANTDIDVMTLVLQSINGIVELLKEQGQIVSAINCTVIGDDEKESKYKVYKSIMKHSAPKLGFTKWGDDLIVIETRKCKILQQYGYLLNPGITLYKN